MVDINLIGDDKTGEEERVEDFAQTSSMDTQELAFEERTETFDTTKTAGFAQRRSYSSLISTLIIVAVIVLLGGAIYFFMFTGDDVDQFQAGQLPPAQEIDPSASDDELARLEQEFAAELANNEPAQPDPEPRRETVSLPPVEEPAPQPAPTSRTTVPPSRPAPARSTATTSSVDAVAADFLANSRATIQGVTSLMSALPSNLNATLVSYNGRKVRLEIVSNTAADARDFANGLNQIFPSGKFSVVSESTVASNGASLDRVLVSGTLALSGGSASGAMRFMNTSQMKEWLTSNARQFGLTVRELKTQQGSFAGGYHKVPVMARLYGDQPSILGFLEEMAAQSVNVEVTKILLVSPDMVNYSDDKLITIVSMYLYEQG